VIGPLKYVLILYPVAASVGAEIAGTSIDRAVDVFFVFLHVLRNCLPHITLVPL
jgi:hypothetical protein